MDRIHGSNSLSTILSRVYWHLDLSLLSDMDKVEDETEWTFSDVVFKIFFSGSGSYSEHIGHQSISTFFQCLPTRNLIVQCPLSVTFWPKIMQPLRGGLKETPLNYHYLALRLCQLRGVAGARWGRAMLSAGWNFGYCSIFFLNRPKKLQNESKDFKNYTKNWSETKW
jgi:hypothetical protein